MKNSDSLMPTTTLIKRGAGHPHPTSNERKKKETHTHAQQTP
jgi:hypothetical protein